MKYKIHPAIGIARIGDSTSDFCLAPETPRGLPINCDNQGRAIPDSAGHEQPISKFKDDMGRILRQGARFRVFAYADDHDAGHELKIGEKIQVVKWNTGELITGTLSDIKWMVYLANKKASWYEFQQLAGEHGYAPNHPLRNAGITDPNLRQQLIIDPGPQTVQYSDPKKRHAEFAKGKNPGFPQSFPPALAPNNIDTLGEIITHQQDGSNRLVVLGGFGNSGSCVSGFGQPSITTYANNDGWFDDVSDGPVTATLIITPVTDDGDPAPSTSPISIQVDDPAWVLTAYPGYAPEIENMITLEDVVYDVAVRWQNHAPQMFAPIPAGDLPQRRAVTETHRWNENYHPWFYRDIWPILRRPNAFQWVMVFDPVFGGDPHSTAKGGDGNLDEALMSIPPHAGEDPTEREERRRRRQFIYNLFRQPGEENKLRAHIKDTRNYRPPLMPLLCGDNPIDNTLPSKFLHLTDTQLFLLRQWAEGKFINERLEGLGESANSETLSGYALDRGVLWNALGGAFCPGGEVAWIIRNPAIYTKPYRIRHAPCTPGGLSQPAAAGSSNPSNLANGLEPGDLTKYGAVPWQADFNECSTQDIDVTYVGWNKTYSNSAGDPDKAMLAQTVYWWPAHRPMEITLPDSSQASWSRNIPQNNAGDLQMVTAWKLQGFILRNTSTDPDDPQFIEVERNDGT